MIIRYQINKIKIYLKKEREERDDVGGSLDDDDSFNGDFSGIGE